LADFLDSSLKPFGQMNQNWVGSIHGKSSVTNAHFFPIRLLMNRDKMSNLYREPSIDASYQVSVHLIRGHDFYKSTN
jgi:hypothetical protein